jgi:pyridoxamine 5'-phosphate oxidase
VIFKDLKKNGGCMTKEEIISFMKANPICYLATVEGDRPHVRPMGMYKADERGILIQLSTVKGMYRELVQNPKVELCFNGSGKMVRVSGIAEFIEDQGLKEEVVKARPFLKPLVDAHGWVTIKVFRVTNPVATVWTMATNLEPKDFIKL